MENKVILTLMRLKGISRKTIINGIPVTYDTEYSRDAIKQLLDKARENSKKVREYSLDDVSVAMQSAEKIEADCSKLGIQMVSFVEDGYPLFLRKCDDPPAIIYYKGDISYLNSMNAVAIIGTREPSAYGTKVAFNLGEEFAKRGFVDVSGLALGCDGEGHKGCLNGGGKTVAVLAGGLDSIYPAKNKGLAEEIVEKGGALISEYPPYAKPFKAAFVDRDRIQAALSCGVMVVETKENGGTMHAVRYSGDYGRLVGCFRHPEKYAEIEQAAGNRVIVNEGKGIYVGDDNDLDEYCRLLAEKGDFLRNNGTGQSSQEPEYVQISIFDKK